MEDYYKILGLSPDCSADKVKKAYRRLAKQYHPDTAKNSGLPEDERQRMAEKFKEVNEANAILSQPAQRNRYDRTLKEAGHPFFQTSLKNEPREKRRETKTSSRSPGKPKKPETKGKGRSNKKNSSQGFDPSKQAAPKRPADRSSSSPDQQKGKSGKRTRGHRQNSRSPQNKDRDKQEYSREEKENRTFYNNGSFSGQPAAFNGSYRQYKKRKQVHGIIIIVMVGLSFLLVFFTLSRKNREPPPIEPAPVNLERFSGSRAEKTKQQIMQEILQNGSSDSSPKSSRPSSPETGKLSKRRLSKEPARSPGSKPETFSAEDSPAEPPSLLDQIWDDANIN